MGTFAPIVVYWAYAGFYQLLPPMDNYRLHTRKEEDEKNSVHLAAAVKGVLLSLNSSSFTVVSQGLFLSGHKRKKPAPRCILRGTA
ncbi:hypothetical protein SAY86_013166 [Trapa natans]|nr:hypothetical protein SAY86_013166 [Trapa natans]